MRKNKLHRAFRNLLRWN